MKEHVLSEETEDQDKVNVEEDKDTSESHDKGGGSTYSTDLLGTPGTNRVNQHQDATISLSDSDGIAEKTPQQAALTNSGSKQSLFSSTDGISSNLKAPQSPTISSSSSSSFSSKAVFSKESPRRFRTENVDKYNPSGKPKTQSVKVQNIVNVESGSAAYPFSSTFNFLSTNLILKLQKILSLPDIHLLPELSASYLIGLLTCVLFLFFFLFSRVFNRYSFHSVWVISHNG
jgi:hypothetical protein